MTNRKTYWKGAALLSAPFLFHAAAQAETDAKSEAETVLRASSPWSLDYSKDSCRVGRSFGTGEQRTVLQLTQFEPNHSFMLAIAGGGLGKRISSDRVRVQFGPMHDQIADNTPSEGTIGDLEPGLIWPTMAVRMTEQAPPSFKAEDQERIAQFKPADPVTLQDEAKVEWIEVSVGAKPRVRLETGPMGELFAALKTCSEELLTDWGLDLERHRNASRDVVPLKAPARWIGPGDYPNGELRDGSQALVYFRLMVDEEGKASSCHIQQSGYSEAFDRSVCAAMMRNARFDPALDADGKPMKSYFRTSVRFVIP